MKVVLYNCEGDLVRYVTGFEKTGQTSRRGDVEDIFKLTTSTKLQDAMLFNQIGVAVDLRRMEGLLAEDKGTLIDQVYQYLAKPVKIVPLS